MSNSYDNIVDLVRYLVTALVDDSDSVSVEPTLDGGYLKVIITTHPDDTGKVIGRGGRTIKSIRTLARAAASSTQLSVDVDVEG